MRPLTKLLVVVLGVALAPGLRGQATDHAVPSQWVSGSTLTVTDLNFAVTAPDSWRWRQIQLPRTTGVRAVGFRASNPDSDRTFAVLVQQVTMTQLSTSESERLARGLATTLPAGWTVAKIETAPSDIPSAGAQRFKTVLQGPDEGSGFCHGYIVPGPKTYILLTTSQEPTEQGDFVAFVGTFHLIQPRANVDTTPMTTAAMFWIAVVGAFFDWRYVRAGGKRPTKRQKLGFGAALAICPGLLTYMALQGRSAEDIGRMTALLTSQLFFWWEVARWLSRKKNRAVHVGQEL